MAAGPMVQGAGFSFRKFKVSDHVGQKMHFYPEKTDPAGAGAGGEPRCRVYKANNVKEPDD